MGKGGRDGVCDATDRHALNTGLYKNHPHSAGVKFMAILRDVTHTSKEIGNAFTLTAD